MMSLICLCIACLEGIAIIEAEGGGFTLIRPKKSSNGGPLPVVRIGNANDVKAEILWRYVTAKNTVVYFNSAADLIRDVEYRRYVVATAKLAKFAYIGDGYKRPDPLMNKEYWNIASPSIGRVLPASMRIQTDLVSNTTSAFAAVKDIFTNPDSVYDLATTKYSAACQGGSYWVCMWAVAQATGKFAFENVVGGAPVSYGQGRIIKIRKMPNPAFWIPGDWGNIANKSFKADNPAHEGREGENMIYMGGCFDEDFDSFKRNALFWGHGMSTVPEGNVKTLEQMLAGISHWGELEIDETRRDINHDVFR